MRPLGTRISLGDSRACCEGLDMPTAAMEHSMTEYRPFARSTVGGMSAAEQRRRREREELQTLQETQEALSQRSGALAKLAEHMAEQNEQMLAGIRKIGQPPSPPGKVDFIARNVANAGARQPLDRKEQALIARAEVMAAATAHLQGSGTSALAAPRRAQPPPPERPAALGTSTRRLRPGIDDDAILERALAEMAHGESMSAFESKTRRAPAKGHR